MRDLKEKTIVVFFKMLSFTYVIAVIISLIGFGIYACCIYENNIYYEKHDLSKSQSDEIKERLGFSQFVNLKIQMYSHKLVYGDDAIAHYLFEVTVPQDEYDSFSEYIGFYSDYKFLNMKPRIEIHEDFWNSEQLVHEMVIDYIGQEGSEGDIQSYVSYTEHDVRYSEEVYFLIPKFLFLLFVYLSFYLLINKVTNRKAGKRK